MAAALVMTASLGDIMPQTLQLQGLALSNLQAQIAGLTGVVASLTITPPSIGANLAIATAMVVSLSAAITIGAPSIDLQISASLAQIAVLEALIAGLDVGLGTGGISLYAFAGQAQAMGPELAAVIGGGPPGSLPQASSVAVALAASSPSAVARLRAFFALTVGP